MLALKGSYTYLTPLSSTFPLVSSILRTYRKPNYTSFHRFNLVASSSSSVTPISTSPVSISHKPQIPLFLRPPIYSTTLLDLHNFITWAKTLAFSIGSTFAEIDNGPDSTLLVRELNWFLDDAIEDPLIVSQLGVSQIGRLWSKSVGLRASLDDMPETGKIVHLVEKVMGGEFEDLKDGVWADLGTGSGALAIAISRVLGKNGKVIATDLSPVAVAVASYNVERYGLQDLIKVEQGSWFEPLKEFEGQLAGVVSNPPYIPSEDISGLQAEVGRHEPILALDGGEKGMDDLFHLSTRMSIMLKPGGFFVVEVLLSLPL
uniref:Methyltransferase small domain-containing protein n=1 Tax=Chenopodium quinoa TaxID=63459 RepID=A0A803MUH9_CHEQI